MSNTTTDESPRSTCSRYLMTAAFGLVFVACAVLVFRIYSQYVEQQRIYAVEQRWVSEFVRLGARAHAAGYRDASSWLERVPIVAKIVPPRSHVVVFLDNPAIVEAILDRATDCLRLGRVFVDLTVFDRSMRGRIEQRLPGVDVTFYTP